MKKDWILTQELLDELLSWLDEDRERAGQEYEALRQRLIKLFVCRNCHEAEDLADETINRVANKVREIKDTFEGPRAPYFFAVANRVHKEYIRRRVDLDLSTDLSLPQPDKDIELDYACLDQCMEKQNPLNRRLVLEYYQGEKKAKIDHRKLLAEQYGIALNALRIRAHRIRSVLEECVEQCLSQAAA